MNIFMQSERLWFRAPEATDLERLAGWINHPDIRRYLAQRVFPINLEAEREWLQNVSRQPQGAAREHVVMLFGLLGKEEPIGSAGLHGINWIVRRAEFGILIGDPAQWSRRFGREVTRRMAQYAFEDLNLNRVELRVNARNVRGRKAYEAAGFTLEATLRQATYADGQFDDILVMSLLREEWQASRGEAPLR
jgi:RimJ/RimL family protein N-acetyltransferase